jgi:hypothetical protein
VQVKDAEDGSGGRAVFGDDERCDLVAFHKGECFAGEGSWRDRSWRAVEDLACGAMEGFGAFAFEEPAQIAVGENAEELTAGLDGGDAEALGGDLMDDLGHGCGRWNGGNGFGGMHELCDGGEAFAELTTWMQLGEVLRLEVEASADVDGEGVAEGEHGGCGRGGRELVVAGFAVDGDVQRDGAGCGERGAGAAGDGDERYAEAWKDGQEAKELFAFAGVGEREENVSAGEQAEIAVQRFGGVEEGCGRSGRDESCGDFAGDEAAFADACDDDAMAGAGAAGEQGSGVVEGFALRAFKALGELLERGGFDTDDLCGRIVVVIHGRCSDRAKCSRAIKGDASRAMV